MSRATVRWRILIAAVVLVILTPGYALAYIGPGAGFALAGSFLAVFGAMFSAVALVISWPVRRLLRMLFRKRPPEKPRFKRVVVLGLDGLDYNLTEKLLDEGRLPNLAALRDQGDFKSLASTLPPISPVAWSSFQTGVNPGKHNIFDFLTPDRRTYAPKLSSVEIRSLKKRIGFGPLQFQYSKPDIRMLRKSKPFWSYLSDYGIFNCIIRVPITFPPEKLRGVQLSAMCVPDLRGTQGTFSHYTTRASDDVERTGGEVVHVHRTGNTVASDLLGPPDPHGSDGGSLKVPFKVTLKSDTAAQLKIGGSTYPLKLGEYTDWITVRFKFGFRSTARGVCRFLLLSTEPEFSLYVTPINIDPEKPAMAIGYPKVYPIYLAKRQGPYATLGLAEDTWGLSEQVLEDEHFLRQCMEIDVEREKMFFDSLEKVPDGLCVCVFDGTDRLQHMFWRYHDQQHPARPDHIPSGLENTIEDLYIRMDALVGRTMARCNRKDTLLMVLSDHGFNTFRRCVDLNRWLEENGYLVVDDSRRGEQYLAGIDWSQTRAFALGLTGIFLNVRDKFEQGIVEPGQEAEALAAEIAEKIRGLKDVANGAESIKRAYQASRAYRGPYKDNAPDIIIGYASGYRVSWDTAVGKTGRQIFADNHKAWSGDHCVDPSVVPGVLFCNRKLETDRPRLLEIGPTIMKMFGVPVPEHMDGQPFEVSQTWTPPAVRPTQHAPDSLEEQEMVTT